MCSSDLGAQALVEAVAQVMGCVQRVAEESLAVVAFQIGVELGDVHRTTGGAGRLELDGQWQPAQLFDDLFSRLGIAGVVPGATLRAVAFGEELDGGGRSGDGASGPHWCSRRRCAAWAGSGPPSSPASLTLVCPPAYSCSWYTL